MEPTTAAEQEEEANLLIPPPVPLTTEMDGDVGVTTASSGGGGNDRVGGSMVSSMQMVLESKIAPIVEYLNLVMVQKSIFLVFQGIIVMMMVIIRIHFILPCGIRTCDHCFIF